MEAHFWHQRWENKEIGFHASEVNPFLRSHISQLKLQAGDHIFLPLCGKTKDIAWLLEQGYQVTGAELSEIAVKELFQELRITPTTKALGELTEYSSGPLRILVGDIFQVNADILGSVQAIYDRAALVALPDTMRTQYTAHLIQITQTAPQLLITYFYNQQLIAGPPFALSDTEVHIHYASTYHIAQLECQEVAGGLKGKVPSQETVWLLTAAQSEQQT